MCLKTSLLFIGAYIVLHDAFPKALIKPTHDYPRPGELLSFSLTTLTPTGYGDMLPMHPLARSLASLAAVIG